MKKLTWRILLAAVVASMLSAQVVADNPFTPDSQPTGWLSAPMVSFFDVSSGSEHFYRIAFFKDTWSGNVFAHDVSPTGVVDADLGPWGNTALNNAALALEAANYDSGRKIATSSGRAFRWSAMTDAEKTALGSDKVLDFVRGDRSNEEPNGLAMRNREYVLGDILHSNINYWDNGTTQSLFVGGNDGMLHVFNATNGQERFAYVPSMLIPRLARLAAKPYVHTHFVDGSMNIANVAISGTTKTILVSGLGAGGKGLFALNVSSHTAASEADAANKLMWEIGASGSYAALGYTYGTPLFTRLSGTAVVVFANGYMSATGRAVLYIANADTGALISAIDTGTGSVAAPNGLSSPTLYDANQDGVAELAYAGDLDGQLWKFNLATNTATLLFTTSPVQSITAAPVVQPHPLGGQMVNFATGRMLSSGDKNDTSIQHAYGIWDGAPVGNNALLTQTLANTTHNGVDVRTVSADVPDWTTHKGWKVALHAGERVVGERPFANAGRYYFLATNPVAAGGENFLYELVSLTGGAPLGPIFDLNGDGVYNNSDLAANGGIPVAKYLGLGIFSQPRLIEGDGLTTTLYVFHPDLPIEDGVPTPPQDPGVSFGHFDFDVYYYDSLQSITEQVPDLTQSKTPPPLICSKTSDVSKQLDSTSALCSTNAGVGYTYLSDYVTGAVCAPNKDANKVKNYQTLTCNPSQSITYSVGVDYKKKLHVHEYDDLYDVTGVNMLNASRPEFNLPLVIPGSSTPFKILIMNQYLNPAVQLAIGGPTFVDVKDYGGLATGTQASSVLSSQPVYTRATLSNLIFNLPLDAFKNKDWWGDGGTRRAGLHPTQTGCVNNIEVTGAPKAPGKAGPNGERFNGAFAIQLIRDSTPSSALELNGPNSKYGWRVKASQFSKYVLAEYSTFWHHPNKICYGDAGWVPDPPEDFSAPGKSGTPAAGSADPKGGVFGIGVAIINEEIVISNNGLTTTTTLTYNDGSQHIRTETINDDGSTTIHQVFRDGSEETVTIGGGRGGDAGYIDPNTGSPLEESLERAEGRQSWRDLID